MQQTSCACYPIKDDKILFPHDIGNLSGVENLPYRQAVVFLPHTVLSIIDLVVQHNAFVLARVHISTDPAVRFIFALLHEVVRVPS
jgi:hypothetical protein